ncbi:profilin [Pilobolus umbonatus]|nr:profilin [Pilobolus umbonatus]
MSWQAYVDNTLLGTGNVSKACILGAQGGVWATSEGFNLPASEIKELVDGFSNPDAVRANGIHINGVKYLTLRADDRSIYGKKNDTGVVVVKTTQAILVGLYDDKIQPGNCTKVVEGLADYFIGVGY